MSPHMGKPPYTNERRSAQTAGHTVILNLKEDHSIQRRKQPYAMFCKGNGRLNVKPADSCKSIRAFRKPSYKISEYIARDIY